MGGWRCSPSSCLPASAAAERVFGSLGPPLTEHAENREISPRSKVGKEREGKKGRKEKGTRGRRRRNKGRRASRVSRCSEFFIGILIEHPIISYAVRHKFITFRLAVKTNQLLERRPCCSLGNRASHEMALEKEPGGSMNTISSSPAKNVTSPWPFFEDRQERGGGWSRAGH